MGDSVLFEKKGRVGIMSINRPKANQLSSSVFEEMRVLLDKCEADKETTVIILTGAGGKIFCAGADLTEGYGDMSAVDYLKRGQDVWNKIEDFPKPIIAAVNGPALGGGCELAMACHLRFIAKSARMGLSETNLGIIPGYGGTLRLPKLIGRSKALEYMLLGKPFMAEEAVKLGLADRLCEDDKLMDDALEFANQLMDRPPLAVKAILKIMSAAPGLSPERHLKMEREELAVCIASKDMREGVAAFMEKRKPVFKGEESVIIIFGQ